MNFTIASKVKFKMETCQGQYNVVPFRLDSRAPFT